ncbi:hypothetical protein TNCV_959791 [Trichonephila clavipes]|nr:hypothetical protein TNCV_959791 [Trichonephila clavipes]
MTHSFNYTLYVLQNLLFNIIFKKFYRRIEELSHIKSIVAQSPIVGMVWSLEIGCQPRCPSLSPACGSKLRDASPMAFVLLHRDTNKHSLNRETL